MKLDLSKINVLEFLNELGMMKIRKDGNEINFSCPFGLHMKGGAISMRADNTVYSCFGCGAKGNALTFLEDLEDLSTGEAIRWLGERWDVSRDIEHKDFRNVIQKKLDRSEKRRNTIVTPKNYALPILSEDEILKREVDWFKVEQCLYQGYDTGGLDYLFDRGFACDILINWEIGWDELSSRFSIPYRDADGNLIGFKGRGLADRIPKYHVLGGDKYGFDTVNVSQVLFGIHKYSRQSSMSRADTMIITEGELNCISLHQDGFTNAVGISGRHLSDRQLKLIKANCSHATLIFDDFKDERAAARQLKDYVSVSVAPEHDRDPADMTKHEKSELLLNAYSGILL